MKFVFWYGIISTLVCWCHCQYPTLVINVFVVVSSSSSDLTLVCNVPSSTNLTRWTYLSGPTGTSLMSFQNGRCTLSPSDSFFNIPRYSYTCNNTVHQVTFYPYLIVNRHILACRDAVQPDESGSTWMFKVVNDGEQCNCDSAITFSIREITEGDNVIFICRVSSGVAYVNWNRNIGSNTAAMSGQNGQCTTQGTTFLDNSGKYGYICNKTVYQLTVINVQRSEHNDMYMCTPFGQTEGTGSNWIIKVNAAVTSVTITSSGYPVKVKENTPVEFKCTTSTARPAASVYWYRNPNGDWQNLTQITGNITTSTDYNDFSVITSILRFVPTRQDNDTKIYCKANNSINTSPVSSERKLLNVLYKAEEPYITQGKEYSVIENIPGTLSCTVKGGNPTPTLSWSCNTFSPTNQLTISYNKNITTTTLTWTPSRTHEGTCTCISTQTGFTNETIDVSVIVLFPPSKPDFIVYGSSVDGDISFIEDNSRTIICKSVSKPSPDRYIWAGPKVVGSTNIQILKLDNIRKIDAGEYKCSVHNTMNPSIGEPVAGINQTSVNVDVLYPPSGLYFVYGNQSGHISNKIIIVIQGDTLNIVCISIDGNPSPIIKWNEQSYNGSVLTVENIKEAKTNATCTATNNMKETNRQPVQGTISDTIVFNILIRPTITECGLYYENLSNKVFKIGNGSNSTVKIKENESFNLKCSAEGKPMPTVWWKIPQGSFVSSPLVSVDNLTRHMKGDYVFTANSLLEPSFKGKQNFTIYKTVSVQILYTPVVLSMNNISILKGEQLIVKCNYTAGVPETTSVKWTRDFDDREWTTAILNIGSLEKSDTGIYTCSASNIMIQSGDSKSYIGQHNQSLHLDVLYETVITKFAIDGFTSQVVIINESDPIRLICNANSNPTAVMTLRHESDILMTATSNSAVYDIAKAGCLDAGIFYCLARNYLNEIHQILQLFVNCHPRAEREVEMFIKSANNERTHITFKAIAYPPPTLTWFRLVEDNWIIIENEGNFVIQTIYLQSTLIIVNVCKDDFTRYKVIAENKLGQFEQIYVLYPYGIPDTPTELKQLKSHTTSSSIYVEWRPGFNGGQTQTFYVKYKKSSDTTWTFFTVVDIEEETMDISLTGLAEDTQYDIVIFASNEIGNSSGSPVLIASTKGTSNTHTNYGPLVGGIVGGVTGCVMLVVIIIVIIRRYTFCKVCAETVSNEKRVEDITNENNDATEYDEIGSVINTNNTLAAEDTITKNVSSFNTYEMVNLSTGESKPYSTLAETEKCTTSDTTNEDTTAVYENMKIQVV